MKRIVVIVVLILSGLHMSLAQPQLKFSDTKKSFGFVKQGKVVIIKYEFINKGNEPLIINEPKVECSCTQIEKPDKPILPKEKGIITVTFSTANLYDRQDRIVEISTNDPKSPATIRFKG
ncbi:MAG TPA: DUF1573 domain-containing protein, partial [Nitrosopumilaceae archaeon]|nr:DUF1573 domain-containing protein [Nitrosopumilaceae archaeon]